MNQFSAVSYEDLKSTLLVKAETLTDNAMPEPDLADLPFQLRRSLISIPSSVDWRSRATSVKDQVCEWSGKAVLPCMAIKYQHS